MLVLFSLALVLLMGVVGLVVDGGMLASTYRQARNAADAAAMAAAKDLFAGRNLTTARTTAETFVHTYNELAGATVVVNNPPLNGAYAGNANFVEVIVTYQANNHFVHLSAGASQASSTVKARAVAGTEDLAKGEGAIVLDPKATPGLSISGGATLKVDGAVLINAGGAGYDRNSAWVNTGYPQYAATATSNSQFKAQYVQVFGGVDAPTNFQSYSGGANPLYAGYDAMLPDPLRTLPIPTTTLSGGTLVKQSNVSLSKGSLTLSPGIYGDIKISSSAAVTFNPGIYILRPANSSDKGLTITGSPTITANGVMFYVTGSSYESTGHPYGYYDNLDGALDGPLPPNNGSDTLPAAPDPSGVKWASVSINATGAQVNMTGIQDANSPFNDILFFQRRRNTSDFNIQGNAGGNVNLNGAVYAKWANMKLAGGGRYGAQFVVGSMTLSGQADVTILGLGSGHGVANEVFLVE